MEKKKSAIIIIEFLLMICFAVIIYYLYKENEYKDDSNYRLVYELNLAKHHLDSIKSINNDSFQKIDSVKKEIVYVEKKYEKDYHNYLIQCVDSDAVQFARYIISEDPAGFYNSNY